MTLREKIYLGLAVSVGAILLIIFRDSRAEQLIQGFFRRKMVEDLPGKIEASIKEVDASIAMDKKRLTHEAERYRNMQQDESPEAIKKFYEDLLSKRTR